MCNRNYRAARARQLAKSIGFLVAAVFFAVILAVDFAFVPAWVGTAELSSIVVCLFAARRGLFLRRYYHGRRTRIVVAPAASMADCRASLRRRSGLARQRTSPS
jgi:hypothetical protein